MALRQIQPLVDMHIVMLQPDGISPALLSKLEDNRFLDMPLNKNGSQYYVLNQTDSRYVTEGELLAIAASVRR